MPATSLCDLAPGSTAMSTERPPAITDADVRSLAAKLKGLHALSTPAEQELLRIVLGRAAQREETGIRDTAGFVWAVSFNPFTYLDAIDLDALEEQGMRHGGAVRRTKQRRTTTSDTERKPT